jgi:glycosyltransferase involved in cell wall biosynthesis
MYTGHLYSPKGVEVLVDAASDLDATVYVVGGYQDDIQRVRDVTTADNVVFTGFIDPAKIPVYQCAADALVAPYTTNARDYLSPLKLFEYMAAGRPIVASNLDILREVLDDGSNALLVPPEDASALAEALSTVLKDDELAATLSATARSDADQYTWDQRASDILSFVNRL